MKLIYKCKENDNAIECAFVEREDGTPTEVIDELMFFTPDLPDDGKLVIGINDLEEALMQFGYVVLKA